MQSTSDNKGMIFGIVAITVLIFGGLAAAIYFAPPSTELPQGEEQVSFNDASGPSLGLPDAKVVVHLYSDFQCPACRVAEPGLKVAMAQFNDRVRFVWKDFPLSSIHKNARPAANAARCAEEQNAFWRLHDKLFEAQTEWSEAKRPQDFFSKYARDLGLNGEAFDSCVASSKYDGKVAADVNEGDRNGVNSTPTNFVNNRRYHGMSASEWTQVLNEALAAFPSAAPVPAPVMTTSSTPTP